MTYVVPDPRTEAFARIPPGRCLIVANADLSWSVAAAGAYATARGIPAGNIVQVALGTTASWDPGSNAVIADFATTIRNAWIAKDARAVLIAPGCPAWVAVRGVTTSLVSYDPTAIGYPSFGHLVQGSPSYNTLIGGSTVVACRENGSGRWEWYTYGGPGFPVPIWRSRTKWKLGLTEDRDEIDADYETTGLIPIAGAPSGIGLLGMPTPLATTYAGWAGSRVVPAGRIGWTAWRLPSTAFAETEANWDDALASSQAADAWTSQPGPIVVSLNNGTGSMQNWASIASAARGWGYDVAHYYRTTSINAAVEVLCPVAEAAWTKTQFESGAIVGEDYYVFCGDCLNADDPVRSEPFKSALTPLDGASVTEIGPSYGYEWGIRGLQSGAAAASMDVTHRTSGETTTSWLRLWQSLRGLTGLEIGWDTVGAPFPSGDPLHRPFHFDPAGALDLYEESVTPPDPPDPPDPPEPVTAWYPGERIPHRRPRPKGHRRNLR